MVSKKICNYASTKKVYKNICNITSLGFGLIPFFINKYNEKKLLQKINTDEKLFNFIYDMADNTIVLDGGKIKNKYFFTPNEINFLSFYFDKMKLENFVNFFNGILSKDKNNIKFDALIKTIIENMKNEAYKKKIDELEKAICEKIKRSIFFNKMQDDNLTGYEKKDIKDQRIKEVEIELDLIKKENKEQIPYLNSITSLDVSITSLDVNALSEEELFRLKNLQKEVFRLKNLQKEENMEKIRKKIREVKIELRQDSETKIPYLDLMTDLDITDLSRDELSDIKYCQNTINDQITEENKKRIIKSYEKKTKNSNEEDNIDKKKENERIEFVKNHVNFILVNY